MAFSPMSILGLGLAALLAGPAGAINHLMADEVIGFFRVNDVAPGVIVLTDTDGLTLYTYEKDPPGKATCTAACAEMWPPAVAAPNEVGFGVFAIVVREEDGKRQWTYRDKPLYRNAKDTQPGHANGDKPEEGWIIIEIRAHLM
jgi:predicted lipoprotein with Yx(FWY)xxD motif